MQEMSTGKCGLPGISAMPWSLDTCTACSPHSEQERRPKRPTASKGIEPRISRISRMKGSPPEPRPESNFQQSKRRQRRRVFPSFPSFLFTEFHAPCSAGQGLFPISPFELSAFACRIWAALHLVNLTALRTKPSAHAGRRSGAPSTGTRDFFGCLQEMSFFQD